MIILIQLKIFDAKIFVELKFHLPPMQDLLALLEMPKEKLVELVLDVEIHGVVKSIMDMDMDIEAAVKVVAVNQAAMNMDMVDQVVLDMVVVIDQAMVVADHHMDIDQDQVMAIHHMDIHNIHHGLHILIKMILLMMSSKVNHFGDGNIVCNHHGVHHVQDLHLDIHLAMDMVDMVVDIKQ
jgi:hypothetical protein